MLILGRRIGETVVIQGGIEVSVLGMKGHQVKIGINAPDGVTIVRAELLRTTKPAGYRPRN